MKLRKIALVSMVLVLALSLSTTISTKRGLAVTVNQMNLPFLMGWTNTYTVTSGTGGTSISSANAGYIYPTGKIQLHSYSQSNNFGDIQTIVEGWIMTTSAYATENGLVQVLGKVTLNGIGGLFAIAAFPAGAWAHLLVKLCYEVYDDSTNQYVTTTTVWQDPQQLWALGTGIVPGIALIPLPGSVGYS